MNGSLLAMCTHVVHEVVGRGAGRIWVQIDRDFETFGDGVTVSVGEDGGAALRWSFVPGGWVRGEDDGVLEEVLGVVVALAARFRRPVFRIGLKDRRRLAR